MTGPERAMEEFFGPPISVYTRAEAVEDGYLVDVSDWASAKTGFLGGFTVPVALTQNLWAKVEAPRKSLQDTRGRAHDVLWMASLAVRRRQEVFGVKVGKRVLRLRVVIDGDGATIGYPEDF